MGRRFSAPDESTVRNVAEKKESPDAVLEDPVHDESLGQVHGRRPSAAVFDDVLLLDNENQPSP
jgi:hypothetical protein